MLKFFKTIWILSGVIFLSSFIYIAEKNEKKHMIKSINIKFKNSSNSAYLSKLINQQISNLDFKIINEKVNEIPYKELENKLNTSPLINNVCVYRTQNENFYVELITRIPIARIFFSDGKSYYIDKGGFIFPSSINYSFRVIIVSYDNSTIFSDDNKISEYASKLLKLLMYINKDEFWRAQITKLNINKNGYITIFTQIGKQYIEFGQPENIDTKFEKLKIIYKKILPKVGWNKYKKINLEFDKQVICE